MSLTDFSVSREDRYLEDYEAGTVYAFAEKIAVSEADIIRFAREFDPQYFHLDPEAAKSSIYKGLIASGGHTIALAFRLYVRNFLPGKASLGSPGVDEVRWFKPLHPGDVLRVRVTIRSVKPSRSKHDRGTVTSLVETINQKDEVIMSYKAMNIMVKRGSLL
jgi:acyl dehydratase